MSYDNPNLVVNDSMGSSYSYDTGRQTSGPAKMAFYTGPVSKGTNPSFALLDISHAGNKSNLNKEVKRSNPQFTSTPQFGSNNIDHWSENKIKHMNSKINSLEKQLKEKHIAKQEDTEKPIVTPVKEKKHIVTPVKEKKHIATQVKEKKHITTPVKEKKHIAKQEDIEKSTNKQVENIDKQVENIDKLVKRVKQLGNEKSIDNFSKQVKFTNNSDKSMKSIDNSGKRTNNSDKQTKSIDAVDILRERGDPNYKDCYSSDAYEEKLVKQKEFVNDIKKSIKDVKEEEDEEENFQLSDDSKHLWGTKENRMKKIRKPILNDVNPPSDHFIYIHQKRRIQLEKEKLDRKLVKIEIAHKNKEALLKTDDMRWSIYYNEVDKLKKVKAYLDGDFSDSTNEDELENITFDNIPNTNWDAYYNENKKIDLLSESDSSTEEQEITPSTNTNTDDSEDEQN